MFPETQQLGDITKLDGAEMPIVDIICAGSSCQDLSVSGKREGLAGERSGLFVNAIQIFHDMRKRTGFASPRFFVWENVTGAFSSNHGRDFLAVLESIGQASIPMPQSGRWANAGMVRLEACDIAWRVLDAQYWGVPQSRKRIFLVADFATYGRRAGEILFEPESVRGHSPSEQGLQTKPSSGLATDAPETGGVVSYFSQQRFGVYRADDTSACLAHRDYKGTRDLIVGAVAARDYKGVGSQYVSEGKCQVQGDRVRRLTPLECERLQGLPDNWTAGGSDVERLKAIGDCTQNMDWTTFKDYFQKANEELDEFKEVALLHFTLKDDVRDAKTYFETFRNDEEVQHLMHRMAEEAADVCTVLASLLEACGIGYELRMEEQAHVNRHNHERGPKISHPKGNCLCHTIKLEIIIGNSSRNCSLMTSRSL